MFIELGSAYWGQSEMTSENFVWYFQTPFNLALWQYQVQQPQSPSKAPISTTVKAVIPANANMNDTLEWAPDKTITPASKDAEAKAERLWLIKIRIENFMQKESLSLPFFYELIDTVKDKVVTK